MVQMAAHKTDKDLDRNQIHKAIPSNKEITRTKTDSKETKEMDTMVTTQTGLNRGEDPPNLTIAEQHQRHR